MKSILRISAVAVALFLPATMFAQSVTKETTVEKKAAKIEAKTIEAGTDAPAQKTDAPNPIMSKKARATTVKQVEHNSNVGNASQVNTTAPTGQAKSAPAASSSIGSINRNATFTKVEHNKTAPATNKK